MLSTQGRIPWTGAKAHLQKFFSSSFFFFLSKIESVNLAPQTYREKKQLGRVREGGKGSKLNVTVACRLVADKNQVLFSEKHV